MIKVSIILPNYNHALFLQKRIDSILNQTYQNFELIVLDDCSTDKSRELLDTIKNHPKVSHVVYNLLNSGSTFKQWQKGILLAKGEYIWIAESDDWCENNFLSEMVVLMGCNSNVGIGFCGSNWIDGLGNYGKDLSLYSADFIRTGKEEIKKYLINYNTIQNGSSVILNASLAKKHIKGIEYFKACGDWYLYINILHESNIVYNNDKLNYFRWYHNNTSNKAAKNGTWVSEGIKILCLSKAYKQHYTLTEIKQLMYSWKNKIRDVNSTKIKYYSKLYFSLGIFIFKNLYFKLGKI